MHYEYQQKLLLAHIFMPHTPHERPRVGSEEETASVSLATAYSPACTDVITFENISPSVTIPNVYRNRWFVRLSWLPEDTSRGCKAEMAWEQVALQTSWTLESYSCQVPANLLAPPVKTIFNKPHLSCTHGGCIALKCQSTGHTVEDSDSHNNKLARLLYWKA